MARTSEEELRIQSRRSKLAAMVVRGTTNQAELAQRLGLDGDTGRRMVGRDLAAIKEEWRLSAVRDFDEAKGNELARIDAVEAEAWLAWERSKIERTSNRTKRQTRPATDGSPGTSLDEDETKKEQRDGDPRWLDLVLSCHRQRVAILGLEAPKRVRHGGDEDAPPIKHTFEEFKALPPERKAQAMRERFANWLTGEN